MHDIMNRNSSLIICERFAQRVRCTNRSNRWRNFPFYCLPPWKWPNWGENRTRGQDMHDIMNRNSSLIICERFAQRVRCTNRSNRWRNFPFYCLPPLKMAKLRGKSNEGARYAWYNESKQFSNYLRAVRSASPMHKPIKSVKKFPFYCLPPWKWPNWGGNRTRGQDMHDIMNRNSSLIICERFAQRVRCTNRSNRWRNFPFYCLPPWKWPNWGGNRTRGQDMHDIMNRNSSLIICERFAQRVRCTNRSNRWRKFSGGVNNKMENFFTDLIGLCIGLAERTARK